MEKQNHIDQLLRQLDAHRDAYLAAFQNAHEALAQSLASAATAAGPSGTSIPSLPSRSISWEQRPSRPSITLSDAHTRVSTGISTLQASSASKATGEESEDDEDENLYVQQPLDHQLFDHDGLRSHLRSYKWTEAGRLILDGIVNSPIRMQQPTLFPTNPGRADDRSHLSHHQVYDIGPDGAPLQLELPESESGPSNALHIWNSIREINRPTKARRAVGRITIVREPSPILFGAIHYVANPTFDVDGLFKHLVMPAASSTSFNGAFDDDVRRQRSFVFNFEYFTLIGDKCQPQPWQLADRDDTDSYQIKITRCSSVVALSLGGDPIRKVRNNARRAKNKYGYVYDPFGPWQVLNVQCYPDWRSNTHVHDSTKHYVNGVEAFLITLLSEFRDAQARFDAIYHEITKLITPPADFMFDVKIRDKFQFEDKEFTYTRRYFWAYQTLGIMNESIKAMIDAYDDTFTDDVWEGKHQTIWPLKEEETQRSQYYKKKLGNLRRKFDVELERLRAVIRENSERRDEIRGLREELFSGTSIQESRKSVENTEITIQQGHNIKLLTLVSIFFLPLTFVTSVFGMTNMPTEPHYWMFGIVTATVCVPFFVLIGSLNTTRGMHFWRSRTAGTFTALVATFKWLASCGGRLKRTKKEQNEDDDVPKLERASTTVYDGTTLRMRRWSSTQKAELVSREEEDGIRGLRRGSPEPVSPAIEKSAASMIARMWNEERQRKIASTLEV